jgi:hypothetical protein
LTLELLDLTSAAPRSTHVGLEVRVKARAAVAEAAVGADRGDKLLAEDLDGELAPDRLLLGRPRLAAVGVLA